VLNAQPVARRTIDAKPQKALDTKPVAAKSIETKSVETKPVLTPRPDNVAPTAVKPVAAHDDLTLVKEAIFHYLARLNAGDVSARANCQLSEFTSFGVDGRPLESSATSWRTAPSDAAQAYDLRCRDLRVYIHKDTAISTAYLVGTILSPGGAPVRISGRSSWVHLRQSGEWKMAHNHLSPLNPDA
jgi:ketosteroid isomerase-like protein